MMKLNKTQWYQGFAIAISYVYIFLFIYAAFSKLTTYDKFIVNIGQSAMLSAYAGILAWLVPLFEILLSVMLVFPAIRLYGLYGSFSLMVMFTAYIFIVLVFMGADAPCQCGGLLSAMSWSQHLVFNVVFTGLAGVGVLLERSFAFALDDKRAMMTNNTTNRA